MPLHVCHTEFCAEDLNHYNHIGSSTINLPASAGDMGKPWKMAEAIPIILPGISMDRSLVRYSSQGHKQVRHNRETKQHQQTIEASTPNQYIFNWHTMHS